MQKKILYGTDPEGFAIYYIDGKPYTLPPYFFRKNLGVSASDDVRHPVFFSTKDFTFLEDGAAFEMSIKPSYNPRELFNRIQECAGMAAHTILSKFPEHCLPELQFLPTVGFDVKRWESMGDDFKMSTEFGCDPDLDAFDTESVSRVIDASLHPERYGGGHLHWSGSEFIKNDPILTIQVLALTAGCAAILYTDVPDLEKQRTFLYGRPGKYRIQNYGENPYGDDYSYGIEYRTVSCRWASDWRIAEKIFEWGTFGFEEVLPRADVEDVVLTLSNTAKQAILLADKKLAVQVLDFLR